MSITQLCALSCGHLFNWGTSTNHPILITITEGTVPAQGLVRTATDCCQETTKCIRCTSSQQNTSDDLNRLYPNPEDPQQAAARSRQVNDENVDNRCQWINHITQQSIECRIPRGELYDWMNIYFSIHIICTVKVVNAVREPRQNKGRDRNGLVQDINS